MAEEVKDSALTKSPEANRLLADALKTPLVPNYKSVVKDLKIPELPVREAVVPEKSLAQPAGQEYLAQMSPKLEAIRVAEKGELERQADMKLKEVEMEGDKYTQLADSAAQQKRDILADPTRADYKRALEDKAKPFVPNEENAQDMMALFGLLNIVGFAIGSGGKEYSQVAMSAMNGMLEGNRKGREDLYKKEKSIFETNQKQLDSRIKQLLAFMQDTELLSGMDKNARDQKIEGEFLKNKADTLKKFYETRGYGPTVEYLKSVSQAMDKAITLNQDESKRAAGEDFKIRTIKAEFEGNRQRDADAFANQISLKQQELQQKAAEAFENRDFELKRDLQSKSFNLQMALANYAHADFIAKLNRDSADAIELARRAEAAGDRATTAAYRARELEIGAARDKETATYRDKMLNLERQRANADKQPSQFFTDPKTQQMYQWDANKKSWVVSPGLPAGAEKPGSGGAGGSDGKGLKPGAKVTEGYVADNQLKTDIEDILKDLRTNPSLVKDLEKYRVEAFLTEEGKVLNQLASADIPPNLRQFLTKVSDLRNNYYLNISGKAVTGGEALRSYGTVPQRGDDAPRMIDKLTGMSKRVSQAISIKQQLYPSLPSLNLNAGRGTSLVPNQDYSRDTEGGAAGSGSVARPKTDAEFNALPRDARYIDPGDGKEYRKK
jgi:hypothetical protein